jgi:DNA-directed RNA polymerase specialized sigma24 family protein
MEEKEYEEISDILQIPIGTVSTLIYRGKKELQKILKV